MSWTITTTHSSQQEYVCSWTSDGSGNVSDAMTATIRGFIIGAYFTPGGTTPTNLYDFQLQDERSCDLLRNGADLSSSATEYREALNYSGTADAIPIMDQKITAVGSNCGASKTGTIRLIVITPVR